MSGVNLLHHHHDHIPFDQDPAPSSLEVGELRTERHQLCSLVAAQRAEIARLERDRDRLAHEIAHLRRQLAKKWWRR